MAEAGPGELGRVTVLCPVCGRTSTVKVAAGAMKFEGPALEVSVHVSGVVAQCEHLEGAALNVGLAATEAEEVAAADAEPIEADDVEETPEAADPNHYARDEPHDIPPSADGKSGLA